MSFAKRFLSTVTALATAIVFTSSYTYALGNVKTMLLTHSIHRGDSTLVKCKIIKTDRENNVTLIHIEKGRFSGYYVVFGILKGKSVNCSVDRVRSRWCLTDGKKVEFLKSESR